MNNKTRVLIYLGLLATIYLTITGVSIDQIRDSSRKHNETSGFITDRPVIQSCNDIGLSGKISLCNPCNESETIEWCSVGCADSKFQERKETFYNNDENLFQTNFADCHPTWQNAVVDLVPVTHSFWSTWLIILVCSFALLFNLATLIFGNYIVFKQALAKGVLEFNQYDGFMRYPHNCWVLALFVKERGHMFAAVSDSVLGEISDVLKL